MGALPESTINLLLSGLMGAIGGFITIPVNTYIMWRLKRDELYYQHKLDVIAKERELFLQHKLEIQRTKQDGNKIIELEVAVRKLEKLVEHG